MIWGAVVVAAGRGARFGRPKQFIEIAGMPMIAWSLRTFVRMPEVAEIVVVTEPEWIGPMQELLAQIAPERRSHVVEGGATRQQSARNGLHALSENCAAVFFHDGARPLVHAEDVRSGMRHVRAGQGALLGTSVVDTVKVIDPSTLCVLRTLDRNTLWAAQTPQFGMRRDFLRAHADAHRNDVAVTDDAALLERIGIEVIAVAAMNENFKVTTPDDIVRAEPLLRARFDHLPEEEEVLLVEVFADDALVDAICGELEARGGTIDGIDRDLPSAVAVRAFVPAEKLHGFAARFDAFGDGTATFTTRFSHFSGRGDRVAGLS